MKRCYGFPFPFFRERGGGDAGEGGLMQLAKIIKGAARPCRYFNLIAIVASACSTKRITKGPEYEHRSIRAKHEAHS